MDAIESMIIGRREGAAVVQALEICAPLFAWLSDADYAAATSPFTWETVVECASRLADSAAERATWTSALAPLSLNEYTRGRDELLVSGTPFSALPVESLYKQWSSARGNLFGGTRGLYLGDPARHLSEVYDELDLVIPSAFAAMPDHLTLELELLALLLRAENLSAAHNLVVEHLDWLAAYARTLEDRLGDLTANAEIPADRYQVLVRGIEFMRTLTLFVDRAARAALGRE